MTPDNVTPRDWLHHAIRREFTSAIARYFKDRPERINDPEMEHHLKALLFLMERVLTAVDTFEVHPMDRP